MIKLRDVLYTLLPGRKKKPDELDVLNKAKEENTQAKDALCKLLDDAMEDLNHG